MCLTELTVLDDSGVMFFGSMGTVSVRQFSREHYLLTSFFSFTGSVLPLKKSKKEQELLIFKIYFGHVYKTLRKSRGPQLFHVVFFSR